MIYSIEHFNTYLRLDIGDNKYVTHPYTIDLYFFVNPSGIPVSSIYYATGVRAVYQGRLWPTVIPNVC